MAFVDSFDRTDNATTMGSADSGQAWTAASGTWGISSGRATNVSDANGNMASAMLTDRNYKLTCKIRGHLSSTTNFRAPAIMMRYADNNNLMFVRPRGGMLELYKVVAGTATLLATPAVTTPDDTELTITVECIDTKINITYNGLSYSYTLTSAEASLASNLGIGFRMAKGGTPTYAAYWDSLTVEA